MIKGLENLPYEKRLEELGLSIWEKKAEGDLITVFQYLKGSYKEDRGSLHKEPHGEDKEQQVQVALGEVSSRQKKEIFFTVRTIIHWKNFSIAGGFQDEIGQGAR